MTDIDDYRNWSAEAQQRALRMLQDADMSPYRPFYCKRIGCDGMEHDEWEWKHARADQHPPRGDWFVWLMNGGRGSGKTRAGSEYAHRMAGRVPYLGLVAPTTSGVRDVMVEGESGILATAPPGRMPQWEPSKHKLTWPNGAEAYTFSAEEPARLRGHQFNWAWLDEPAHTPFIQPVWDNLLLCLRLPSKYEPRVCATTTPTPIPWMKAMIANPDTVVTRVSTYANLPNLAGSFAKQVLARYEGTRLGRQELHGEILEDVEGALWNADDIRHEEAPDSFDRIVVGIDPAGGARPSNDETGIVVVAKKGDRLYVLADRSGRYTPAQWAAVTLHLAEEFSADSIVAERNYGGEMVKHTLRSVEATARVVTVHSRRGKALRAEPIVSLYEQGRAIHCGLFEDLEAQMTSWVPGVDRSSPDRVDALVHGATNLMRGGGAVSIGNPARLRLVAGGRTA